MNIGITISVNKENESLWVNGIKLNAMYLLKALKAAGFNPYLVNFDGIKQPYEDKVVWDTKEFPIYDFETVVKETDLLIFLGAIYQDSIIDQFKASGDNKKVIYYICGNNYINDSEAVLNPELKHFNKVTVYSQKLDEVWYVPQQGELNREYFRVLFNLPVNKVRPVPFVWDPVFLDMGTEAYYSPEAEESGTKLPIYVPGLKHEDKQLACFEPNMSPIKYHMISLLIASDYLKGGGTFKKLNVMCGKDIIKNEYYQSVIKNTHIFDRDDIKLNYQPRLPIVQGLAQFTDIVLAHQMNNPLNYSYLDALYLQFPLVHNAPMIKDAGYYYHGNAIGSGARQLKNAIERHDDNLEAYAEQCEKVLTRYTIFNEGLVEVYQQLVETTMGIKDHKLNDVYDWQTNLYK